MSSYSQFSDSISGVHCHNGSQFPFPNPHVREDMSMELDQDWMANLDPQLRAANLSAAMGPWSEQPLQRFLGEPQKSLFTARSYPSHQYNENYQQNFNRPHNEPAPHPYVYKRQVYSPVPSSQGIDSICSSALSPNSAVDNEWSQDSFHQAEVYQIQENFDSSPLTRSTSHNSQGVPDLIWPSSKSFPHQVDQVMCGVSLQQLQGIPDQGDLNYQEDEGFMENVEMDHIKTEMPNRSHSTMTTTIKQEPRYPYHQSIDEGLGHSLQDESSRRSSYQAIDADQEESEGDIDADAEADNDLPLPDTLDEDDDEEYKPRASHTTTTTSTRRRRCASTKISPITSPITTKRSKISKTAPIPHNKNQRGQSPFQCPSCSKNSFPNSTALQKHISSVHTRAFICTFSFAGCESRFASKNEWKRHVGSQHLCLNYWLCDFGACGKSSSSSSSRSHHTIPYEKEGNSQVNSNGATKTHRYGNGGVGGGNKTNEFNRKDLFTQHLRRMHAPFAVKRQGKKVESWEDRVRELQSSALRVRREAPWRTTCPVKGCDGVFEGKGAWDERMEHVGKHLEKRVGVEGGRVLRDVGEGVDEGLLEWCLREGIVEGREGGGWRLVGAMDRGGVGMRAKRESSVEDADADVDAEGEDDV